MCTNITIESAGRRHYIRGNTYPHKDALRAAGAHWDGDARAWWLGKRDVAAELAERLSKACGAPKAADSQPASERPADRLTDDAKIVGKARYKGKEYILVWEGTTRRGRAAKLAFADGSRVFWSDASEVQVTKRYQSRERYGREQPMTFGRLSRLRGSTRTSGRPRRMPSSAARRASTPRSTRRPGTTESRTRRSARPLGCATGRCVWPSSSSGTSRRSTFMARTPRTWATTA